MRNARFAVLAALTSTLVAAGCGGDDKNDTTTTAATPTTQAATATTQATSTPSVASTATEVPKTVDAAVTAAIESCKSSIDAQPTLAEDVKTDLKSICEKAANGDAAAAAKAAREVCTKIVEASVPAGSARDQALGACKTAGG